MERYSKVIRENKLSRKSELSIESKLMQREHEVSFSSTLWVFTPTPGIIDRLILQKMLLSWVGGHESLLTLHTNR